LKKNCFKRLCSNTDWYTVWSLIANS